MLEDFTQITPTVYVCKICGEEIKVGDASLEEHWEKCNPIKK